MQFRVPQFIDIEDKILGPLTWKQFAYTLGAVGITYISFRFTESKFLGLLISSPFIALFVSLAFVKINNQPFVNVLESAFYFFSKSSLYTWQKEEKHELQNQEEVTRVEEKEISPLHTKKSLSELAESLDIKQKNF